MDADVISQRNTHYGKNVKRLREILGIKQEVLASGVGSSQQKISRLEAQEGIEDKLLERIAKEMAISKEVIKNFDKESVVNFITRTSQEEPVESDNKDTFNSVVKIIELYERMLKKTEEEIDFLRQLLKEKQ